MILQDGKRGPEPAAILQVYHRETADAAFEKSDQAIEIFPRDDFYFGRSPSWYRQKICPPRWHELIEQRFQLSR